ncbi:MAG: 5-(carboxyamino)imidazole ribonucleotide synthase [Proteobacteria bacterium]|nr:5-(carboxyamino)imidazole ribonucleotide synthase [Pseudomonadota bacterium]MDA1063569.1 5-(carboxyamino)imidazole ribonucleotide synthase [Pseudomonadota bacterium]
MRIGIIGAGQLGQMLGFAARNLGMQCQFIDPTPNPPAAVCGPVTQAAFDDSDALARLAASCDVVTYEFENVPVAALQKIADRVPVYPPPAALGHAQDRLAEKQLFLQLDIPLAPFHRVDSPDDLEAAVAKLGLPLVLKTRRLGYDGKGQFVIRRPADLPVAWQLCGGSELIAEQWVNFDYEVSAIGARNVSGQVICYPLTRNEHADGILQTSVAPLQDTALTSQAEHYISALLEHLDFVGVLALEMFVLGEQLLANEFAPRVHNSGHWSIEGAEPSQFTAHLLAITDQSLPEPRLLGHAGMLNLIGTMPENLRLPAEATLHDYGKASRPGRKLGHITVIGDSATARDALLAELRESVTESIPVSGTVP